MKQKKLVKLARIFWLLLVVLVILGMFAYLLIPLIK